MFKNGWKRISSPLFGRGPLHRISLGTTIVAVVVLVLGASYASAAPGGASNNGQLRADQTRAYWTPERIKNAKARDVVRGGPVDAERGKPGGSTSGQVTGASWTAPGLVKSATGKIFFRLDGGDWTCSGSVVADGVSGRSLVLTAAHCAYDEVNDAFATQWMFIPDYDSLGSSSWYFGTSPCPFDKCWVADNLVTTQKWADNGSNKWEEDYAFAVVLDGQNSGSLENVVGGSLPLKFDNSYTAQTWIDAFGYPAGKPYTGSDLVYCAGNDHRLSDGLAQTTSIRCNMTGGSSGGPWLEGFDATDQDPVGAVRSLTSYSYTSAKGYLFGPIFDAYTAATHDAAKTSSANTLVAG